MAIWDFLVKVNGVDLSTLGAALSSWPGTWSVPVETYPEVVIPGRNGTVRTALEPTRASADYTFGFVVTAATEQAHEDAISALKRATRGDVAITMGNQPTKQRLGYRKSFDVIAGLGEAVTQTEVTIVFHVEDTVLYDITPTTVNGSSGVDLALPQGDYRTFGVVTVTSATSPFTLTYKNYAGTTIGFITIAAAGTVVVDMLNRTITVNGSRNDGARTLGDYFAFDPADGDFSLAHWPTLRTSAGSLSVAGGGIVYAKGWQ